MKLDEAIEHAKEVAENWKSQLVNCVSEEGRNKCLECANDHEQLAAWLEELSERREADRWRSISEPPKEHDYYLVTCEFEEARGTDIALFYPDREGEEQWSLNYVSAWKPLPEPYESEDNENETSEPI